MTSVIHHSHDRPMCQDCGDARGPWRPTGEHCEHDIQLFRCARCADRDAMAEQEAQRRAVADIAAAHLEQRAQLIQEADRRADETHRRVTDHIEQFGPPVPELADRTGIGLHHLSAVLRGDGELSVTEVYLLAAALGVDAAAWFAPVDAQGARR